VTVTTKAPDAGWARLSAGIIHDPDWLCLDAAGRLVFMTGIALAKAANRDGELSLRAMTGVMVGALTPKQVQRAASDLVAAGLWGQASHPDRFVVTGFLRWNESTADQEARRARKVTGAHRTNHQLGRHASPEPDCPDCAKRLATANARATGQANATGVAIDRSDADVDVDVDETPPPTPSRASDAAAEAEAVAVADQMICDLGIVGADTARADERRYVAKALARGWTADQLSDLAVEAGARDDVGSPRAYLLGCLKRCANEPPPPSAATDRPRPTLDDERDPCQRCQTTGWIDVPDGVIRCPDCVGATA
jgi:hypothetical protein